MKYKIILVLIFTLFFVTRLYKVDSIPLSLYWDEASIAYNAHSILTTGKDEWGDFLPVHFRAFGEFKLPVFIYSTAFFEAIIGYGEYTVRVTSILYSFLAIILTYLIANKLFKDQRKALLSAFFMTISPWFFIFSRTGYEATAGLFYFLLGFYFLIFYPKKLSLYFVGILSFILSIYSYNSFRIIIPIFLICHLFYLYKFAKFSLRDMSLRFLPLLILGLSLIPIIRLFLYDGGGNRFSDVGLKIDYSNPFQTVAQLTKNYFAHFSQNFLFLSGDSNLRSQVEKTGQLYFIDIIGFAGFLAHLIRSKDKRYFLLLGMILLSLIPAAITKEVPHALRSLAVVPFLSMALASGWIDMLKAKRYYKVLFVSAIVLYLIFFSSNFYKFVSIYPSASAKDWQYPYKLIFTKYGDQIKNADEVIVSDNLGQPYIYALFYQNIDPQGVENRLKLNSVDKYGYSKVEGIDNIKFGVVRSIDVSQSGNLIFAFPGEVDEFFTPRDILYYPDNKEALYVYY